MFGDRTTGSLTELDDGSQEISVRRPNDRFSDRTGWFAQRTVFGDRTTGSLTDLGGSQEIRMFGRRTTGSLNELAGSVRQLVVWSPNIVVCA